MPTKYLKLESAIFIKLWSSLLNFAMYDITVSVSSVQVPNLEVFRSETLRFLSPLGKNKGTGSLLFENKVPVLIPVIERFGFSPWLTLKTNNKI